MCGPNICSENGMRKISGENNYVYWTFKDLEKAYDKMGLWTALRLQGLGGRLLNGVQSFCVNSRACPRVGYSDWYPVKVELYQEVCTFTLAI